MTILAVIRNKDQGAGGKSGSKRPVRRFELTDKELSCQQLWREPHLSVMRMKAHNARGRERRAKKGTPGRWQNCWGFRMLRSIGDVCHEYRVWNCGMYVSMTQIYCSCTRIYGGSFHILCTPVDVITCLGYSLTINLKFVRYCSVLKERQMS